DVNRIAEINLEELGRRFRTQKIIFSTASDLYDQMQHDWKGSREYLLAQLVRLVEKFLQSGVIQIQPPLFNQDDLRRRIVLTLNMSGIVQHIWEAIRCENALTLEPILDRERPIRSTGDMQAWYTGKPCERTKKSHINMCVYDSSWEASESFHLDRGPNVAAWVKNDHLGFEIKYTYKGVVRDFRPDYLVRLTNGTMLVLEVKGQDTQEQQTKREFLAEWVRAVNGHGGFGTWASAVSRHPGDIHAILTAQAQAGATGGS
ncbi:MAG: restriction endonuclease, partial [Candidatus Acidiferrales bacterium]